MSYREAISPLGNFSFIFFQGYRALTFTLNDTAIFGDVSPSVFNSERFKRFAQEDHFSIYDGSRNETFWYTGPQTKAKEATEWVAEIISQYFPADQIFIENEHNQRKIVVQLGHNSFVTLVVKSGCCWDNVVGKFHFQNIRRDRECDALVFVAVYPDEIRMFWAHRCDVMSDPVVVRQHKGADFWIDVNDIDIPEYFHPMDQINHLWE